ncbi:hypothetical protein T06_15980 [Trichinella sp. T6]|nr:hypothetical protein T06_15980 [Trichinella sp. T6]
MNVRCAVNLLKLQVDSGRFLYYKNELQAQMLIESETFPGLPCAYLNTQGSGQSETPLILIDDS